MTGTLTRQWYAATLTAADDGTDTIEPGIWIAVLIEDANIIDGIQAPAEYKACAGQSEITGKSTEEITALLLSRITKAQQRTWTPQVVQGPSDDLGVADLRGSVEV